MKDSIFSLVFCLFACGVPSNQSPLGGQGGDGSTNTPPVTADGCLGDICADARDCKMSERCNPALPTPHCQRLYCGATGTACSEDSVCVQGAACVGRTCATRVDVTGWTCQDSVSKPNYCYSGLFAPALCASKSYAFTAGTCPISGSLGACATMDLLVKFYSGGSENLNDVTVLEKNCETNHGAWTDP